MADQRNTDTAAKRSAATDNLAEDLGKLNLSLDGAADAATNTTIETTEQTQGTRHWRYNLRSRNQDTTTAKPKPSQRLDSNSGAKQDTTHKYIPPHQRAKDSGKDISQVQVNTEDQPSTRPRTRRPRSRKYKTNNLNADAPVFQPQDANRVPPTPIKFIPGTDIPVGTRFTSASSSKQLPQHVLKRPEPSAAYLKQAHQTVQTLDTPRQLLVVLDLNGTLLYRKARGGSVFVVRPKVKEFIRYLFKNHRVMVWSSAKPANVRPMCAQLFTADQHQRLIAIWARDTLRIPDKHYSSKVQVYKQLSWIWEDGNLHAARKVASPIWEQANTVLIDDSVEKAASEPHNLICLEEFEDRPDQRSSDVLGQAVKYLEMLKYEKDVSAFMRLMPFTYSPGEVFDWDV